MNDISRKGGVRLWLLLPVVVAVSAGVWFIIPEKYEAYVWIRVPNPRPSLVGIGGKIETDYPGRDEAAVLVRSNAVLELALRQPGIAQLESLRDVNDKTDWLARNLYVGYIENSEILQIAIYGKNPEDLKKILPAVRTAYMESVEAADRDMHEHRRAALDAAYKNLDKQISRKKIQLKNLSEQLGEPNTWTARTTLFKPESFESLKEKAFRLREQIAELDGKIEILAARLELLPTETEEMTEEQRKTRMESYLKQDTETLTPADKLHAEIEILASERAVFQKRLDAVAEAFKRELAKMEQINTGSVDLTSLHMELEIMQKVYGRLRMELEEMTVEMAGPRVMPIGEPVVRRVIRWFGK